MRPAILVIVLASGLTTIPGSADDGQPLAANVARVLDALELLGRSLDDGTTKDLRSAILSEDVRQLQLLLDLHTLCTLTINPESRLKVERGPAPPRLQQAGFTPVLVKVVNQGAVKSRLRIGSPQAGAPYGGVAALSMQRQDQQELASNEARQDGPRRFLHVEMFAAPPMTAELSGLGVEYVIGLIYSSDEGKREVTLQFDVGQGTQDLGFRGELPILFDIQPAVPVALSIRDHDGRPSYAKLEFRDRAGHVFPPQARRLAPDFFFQPQIYRRDGEVVWLPPGEFKVQYSRGPEYRVLRHNLIVPLIPSGSRLNIELQRWVNPMQYGFFCGDHHIHGAGCAHYTSPTEGVLPGDMFRQVAGEGLNVGCILTWGPCFEYQRQFFSPKVDALSEPFTLLKYDLEISGFGSQALGHVCLLNLRDQTYPGSDGTKEKGWPSWTSPVLKWCKDQGGVTGYAHSASGLQIQPANAAKRLLDQFDSDSSGGLSRRETATALLPTSFERIDLDGDDILTESELTTAIDRAADELPNLAIPEMNSVGAMELPVSVASGLCDFISAMDTARLPEWNMWYHVLNCGFPLKVSGETDFPCMSSRVVGQGRVYVQLGTVDRIDYGEWCRGIAAGRSYVSDGYAHALQFTVDGQSSGGVVQRDVAGDVAVRAKVAFAPETPEAVYYGTRLPEGGRRFVGDTVTLHGKRSEKLIPGGERLVEIVVNGRPVASKTVLADGTEHNLEFRVPIAKSSWIALRQFPQLHTNPVEVHVAGRPIRASADSARWCEETIHQLWRVRQKNIKPDERPAAEQAFQLAVAEYRRRALEANSSP